MYPVYRVSSCVSLIRALCNLQTTWDNSGFQTQLNRWHFGQSRLKEINPEYPLEGLMLKLQYSGHLMRIAASLEKTLMLGKTEGKRTRGSRGWDSITESMDINLNKLREIAEDIGDRPATVHKVAKSRTRFSEWTATQALRFETFTLFTNPF